jgi:cytochrome P450
MVRPFDALPRISGGRGLLGHANEVQNSRLDFIRKLTRETERIARLRVPSVNVVAVNHPEVLHELMVERARDFEKSHLLRYSLYRLAGEGLFTAMFEPWKRSRRMMAPIFHPTSLSVFGPAMTACTMRVMGEWNGKTQIDLLRETTRITMGIAGQTLFSLDTLADSDKVGEALTVALDWAADNAPNTRAFFHLWARALLQISGDRLGVKDDSKLRALQAKMSGPVLLFGKEGKKLSHAIATLDAQVEQIVAARRNSSTETQDLLSRILAARDEEDGSSLTAKQIRDEVLTLFVAGHETTATSLAWCVYLLTRNPGAYAEVQAEVDALSGEPQAADLARLPRTLCAFKEALRMYPPVYLFSRQACRDSQLDGFAIPKYTAVTVSPLALHMREDLWPEPSAFKLDRFLPEEEAKRSRYAWLPFGAGPRVCIGAQFALMEGQLVLASLLRSYSFASTGEVAIHPKATLRPKAMPMSITERRSS